MTNEKTTTMTKTEAKELGGISVRQFANGHLEATFTSVGKSAGFRYELQQRGIEYRDRFARGGMGITYSWQNGSLAVATFEA